MEEVEKLYAYLLNNGDLITRAMQSESPHVILGQHIRTNLDLNPGRWGLLESLQIAREFIVRYHSDLVKYVPH